MSGRTFGSWPTYDGRRVILEGDPRLRQSLQVTVDFGQRHGPAEDTTAQVTVPVAGISTDTHLQCSVYGGTTEDHDPEDAAVEQITAYPANIIPNVSFDIIASAPNGTWGRYLINVTG